MTDSIMLAYSDARTLCDRHDRFYNRYIACIAMYPRQQ
jgi:hypothetical protein